MGLLMDKFKESAEELGLSTDNEDIGISTGIDLLDYANASKVELTDGSFLLNPGISAGSINSLIGLSASGKSALAMMMAANIVKKYDEGSIIYFDAERNGMSNNRALTLSSMSIEEFENKFVRIRKGIKTETVFEMLLSIRDLKAKNKDKLMVESDSYDRNGNKQIMYVPTVVIIDSLAVLYPESKKSKKVKSKDKDEEILDEVNIGSNAEGAAVAKINSQFFGKAVSICDDYNIILLIINHITEIINMNAYDRKPSKIPYLKYNESIPGGSKSIFLSNNVFRLNVFEKFDKSELYGFDGFHVRLDLCKSRSNRSGKKIVLVYNQKKGFDNLYSNYLLLKEYKMISGGGLGYYIEGHSEYKFKQKELRKLYKENKEFKIIFKKAVKKCLNKLALE